MNDTTKRCLYDICVNRKDVLLVDLMNHLHRFLWANQELSVNIGDEIVPTGHLYGFTKFILMLKDRFPNSAIVIAQDGYDKERRKQSPDYKANRSNHDNIYSVVPDLIEFCSLVDGVYTCYHPDYEADDVINSISGMVQRLCKSKGFKKSIYVISNDKDMYQLVDDDTEVPIKIIRKFGSGEHWMQDSEIITELEVQETFNGVKPKDLVKFRAIVGDTSDNLKGYYRFRKADAAIIAESFDYSIQDKSLTLRDGVKPGLSWKRFLPKVLEDMDTFNRNYAIMKMKTFDFEINPACSLEGVGSRIPEVVNKLKKYELNWFMQRLCARSYSPFRDEIIKNV